jgi:MoxR-like ATPase
MATQNPLESSGTYKLPEAQVDRFLFKLMQGYPEADDEKRIITNNMNLVKFEDFGLQPVLSPQEIIDMQDFVQKVYLKENMKDYIVELVQATRKPKEYGISLGKYIEWGGSPRASIHLFISSKADALIHGKHFVSPQYIKNVAYDILRHRVQLNYEAQAEGIGSEQVIKEILSKIPVP